MPEAWLRGPVDGVLPALMPAAHSLIDAREEMEAAITGLTTEQIWLRPGGAASAGFHLQHAAGSLDRLLTYARGEMLSPAQLAAIRTEAEPGDPPADAATLLARLDHALAFAFDAYRAASDHDLRQPRDVGRARLPSTVHGLLFHAAEHTRRHAGQLVTTARIIQGLGLTAPPA
jgi:hypothetical protein